MCSDDVVYLNPKILVDRRCSNKDISRGQFKDGPGRTGSDGTEQPDYDAAPGYYGYTLWDVQRLRLARRTAPFESPARRSRRDGERTGRAATVNRTSGSKSVAN